MTILEPLAGSVPAEWEKFDDRFDGIRGDHHLERLWTGGRWVEGPALWARSHHPRTAS